MRSQWNYLRSREAQWFNIIVNLKVQIRPYKYIHTAFLNPNLQHCTRHKHRGNSHPSFLTSLHFVTLPGPLNLQNFQETPWVYLETSLQPPIDMSQNIHPDMHTQWPPNAALPNPYLHLKRPCMGNIKKTSTEKKEKYTNEWGKIGVNLANNDSNQNISSHLGA